MEAKCPECGAANPSASAFCTSCGMPIAPAGEKADHASTKLAGSAAPEYQKAPTPVTLPQPTPPSATPQPPAPAEGAKAKAGPKPSPEYLVGHKAGEYQITGVVGVGGMGTVYSGIQPLIGKKVAIKVLKSELSDDPEVMERFLAEAKAVNTIGHQNIIDIFAFGNFDDGSQYFVMEYLKGQSLTQYLRDNRPLSYDDAKEIFTQVTEALEAAHEHGIVHRDLKPDNVYLADKPGGGIFVKLLDFGIAKFTEGGVLSGKTRTGVPIGTPVYMSPEQCRGTDVDYASDIYSLGIILYQAFTGSVPFVSDSFFALLNAQLSQAPARPSELAEIPDDLEKTILWCLAKDKADRPGSVRELKETLIPVLEKLSGVKDQKPPAIVREPPDISTLPSLAGAQAQSYPSGELPQVKSNKGLVIGISVAAVAVVVVVLAIVLVPRLTGSKKETRPAKETVIIKEKVAPAPMTPRGADQATIQFMVSPSNAKYEIFVDGKKLDKNEITVPKNKDKPLDVKVVAEGYLPYTAAPKPMGDMVLTIQLTKKGDPRRTGRRRRRRGSRATTRPGETPRPMTRRVKTVTGFDD